MFSLFSSKKTPLIIAFSGGPDSVFLAESLLESGYSNCVIAHFNHHMDIRDGDNIDDEIFAKAYAKEKNILFELGHWEKPENSEEKARNARYLFLESIRQKYKASSIVTAHHKNDVAETVLLQFFRSGGLKSLTGMKEWAEKRKLWRPLLSLQKSEIFEYLHEKNISYCTDSSNTESIFLRNFIRNDVFPLLEKRFPNIQNHLVTQAQQFQQLDSDIEKRSEQLFIEYKKEKKINRTEYSIEMKEVQIYILRKIMRNKPLSKKFISQFIQFISSAESGKKLEIKKQVFTVYGDFLFWENL